MFHLPHWQLNNLKTFIADTDTQDIPSSNYNDSLCNALIIQANLQDQVRTIEWWVHLSYIWADGSGLHCKTDYFQA